MTSHFTCTSSDPYDRHTYEILTNEGKSIRLKYWDEVQTFWFHNSDQLKTVYVRDKLGFGK